MLGNWREDTGAAAPDTRATEITIATVPAQCIDRMVAGHGGNNAYYCSHSPLMAKNGMPAKVEFFAQPGEFAKCAGQVIVPE